MSNTAPDQNPANSTPASPTSTPNPAPTSPAPANPAPTSKPAKSGMAIAAFVLAIIAIALSFVPIINNFAFVLVILAIIFGFVSMVGIRKGKKSGLGLALASIIVAVIAGAIVLGSQAMYGAALDEASNQLDRATGNATEEVLGTDVDIQAGDLTMKKSGYGLIESELPVTVTNLTDEQASFDIQIEAVDANGNRIMQDYIYANDLGAGQSQTFKTFKAVTSDNYDAMKSATFNIVSVGVL